jgi:16S rRNA (uracil1498-N3)-methyltransferase
VKQFILRQEPDSEGFVKLIGEDYRYLARVRRLRVGDGFMAVMPDGGSVHLEVRSVDKNSLCIQCMEAADAAHGGLAQKLPALPPLYLLQSMPKGSKLDLIVRQAAEAGVQSIIPFYSERSQMAPRNQVDGENAGRGERLLKIIRQARQQSGSAVDTRLEAACSFEEALSRWREIRAGAVHPAAVFMHEIALQETALHALLERPPGALAFAVGPEGGFSAKEAGRFIEEGFTPIILGNTILRTETAAIYAIAAVRTLLLDRVTRTALKKLNF